MAAPLHQEGAVGAVGAPAPVPWERPGAPQPDRLAGQLRARGTRDLLSFAAAAADEGQIPEGARYAVRARTPYVLFP